MATVILVRHGRTSANSSGVLAGRTKGVHLDDVGREQAQRVGQRLAAVPLAALVTSPLERTRETAKLIGAAQATPLKPVAERNLIECGYGEWQGKKIAPLAKSPLWRSVQHQPTAVTFPGGESIVGMWSRSVSAVRRIDAEVTAEHGDGAVWAAVSHGDVIKAIVAEALGQPLDLFQRVVVDPGSATLIRYTADRPYVLGVNTHEGDLSWLAGSRQDKAGATVGGGAGPAKRRTARKAP